MQPLNLFLIVLFISVLCCRSEECYDCRYHLNRESIGQCAQSPSDCGSCIPQFVEDENPRIGACHKLEVTVHPPPKTVADDYLYSVDLPCEFSGKVKCGWTHDGQRVDIYNADKFNYREEAETTDCTLTIKYVNESDAGVWQCIALSDSNNNLSIKSNETTLKYYDWSELITVDEGHETLLTCFAEEPVECQWWAKKPNSKVYEIVTIDDAVQYVDKTPGPKRDCSIRIKYMKEFVIYPDYDWVCWADDKVKWVYKSDAKYPTEYFNAMAIGRQTIPIQYYKALDKNGTFSCLKNTMSIEFTLNSTTNSSLNANSNQISIKDIEKYNENKWINVTLTCAIENGYTFTVITNDKSFSFISDKSPKSETTLKDAEKRHFVQIYYKNSLLDGESISYKQLTSANEELQCVTDMNPSEMKWSIDEMVVSTANQVQSLTLTVDKIEAFYLQYFPTNSTLKCENYFSNGTINGVFATINFPVKTPTLLLNPTVSNELYYDGTFALPCAFDVPVRCAWMKKNNSTTHFEEVLISGDYQYLAGSREPTADCSIKIQRLSVKDEGEWICRGYYGQAQHVDSKAAIVIGNYRIVKESKVDNKIPLKSASPKSTNNVLVLISLTLFVLVFTRG